MCVGISSVCNPYDLKCVDLTASANYAFILIVCLFVFLHVLEEELGLLSTL